MKIDRLLAITMMLINRNRITAKELSDHFEVSIRTIYRDIESINQAGIPVVAFQGNNGGFGIMENYRIDRHVLTPDDVGAILTALKGVSTTMDDHRIHSTLEKIRGLIPDSDLELIKKQNEQIMIEFNPWGIQKKEKEKFSLIREAIHENRCIRFAYTNNKNEIVDRLVEPMVMMFKGTLWYLYAFCRLKEDFRVFRLSRMRGVEKASEFFSKREFNPEALNWETGWMNNTVFTTVTLRFQPGMRVRAEDTFDLDNLTTLPNGNIEVKVSLPEDEWAISTILGYGEGVEVIDPPHIRKIIREKAEKMLKLYS